MSLKNKLIAGTFAVSAFAVAGFAQNAPKEAPKDGEAKIERKQMKRPQRTPRRPHWRFSRHRADRRTQRADPPDPRS